MRFFRYVLLGSLAVFVFLFDATKVSSVQPAWYHVFSNVQH